MTLMQTVIAAAEPFEGCAKPDDSWWDSLSWTVPGCPDPASPVGDAIKDSVLMPYVEDAQKGVADTTKTLMTFWTSVPDPTINDGSSTAGVITWLHSNLAWLAAVILTITLAIGAVKMMIEMNGKPITQMFKAVLGYVVISGGLVTIVAAAMWIASDVAARILGQAADGQNFADNLFSLFDSTAGVASAILLVLMFIIAMILAMIMCGVMIGRGALLLVLLGTSIVTAAGAGTDTGKQALMTQLGWIAGWVAIKPCAAIVYGAGFKLLSTDAAAAGNSLLQIIYGLTMIFLSILTLPAVMRLVHPITTPVSSGSGLGGTLASAGMVVASAGLRR